MILARERGRRATNAAPAQRHIAWTCAELATVRAGIGKLIVVPPGSAVMIVGERRAPLLSVAEIDAWSVAAKPRLSAVEVNRLRAHAVVCRVFLHWGQETWHRDPDMLVVRGSGMRGVGPFNRQTAPERVAADPRHTAAAA